MNYLKSITDAVLQSTGVSFPFSIGERIPGLEQGSSIWEIREGVKKVCWVPCLVDDLARTLRPGAIGLARCVSF